MFVRKKQNPSGIISVQIIDKSSGKYQVFKTIGSSADPIEVSRLVKQGREIISRLGGQQVMDFILGDDQHFIETLSHSIQKIQLLGPELILGKLFDQIGFNQIPEDLFRHLVISRLVFPLSKLKTLDYLHKYNDLSYEVDQVYRYLDKFHQSYVQKVQQISYEHTLGVLDNNLAVVFYDVTTLYFEAEREDEFRVRGFSKEGKHKHPQILIGLLVSVYGYPLAYELFEGNKFEGHTMIPVLEAFEKRYELGKLVVVADSGMLSKANIEQLQTSKYEFILGARIKKERADVKQQILELQLRDGKSTLIQHSDGLKLILSYSSKRAKKDAYNRDRGIKRLEKDMLKGRLTKKQLNQRGYNKFLKMTGEIKVVIDQQKIEQDKKWDGLKGYLTNSNLTKEEVIENYAHLWQIEKAFRISKTDLRIRPVFHRLRHRIEAHICISFCAYKLYKELERQLKIKKSELSAEKAIDIMKTIYGLKFVLPHSKETHTMILAKEPEHQKLLNNFDISLGCPSA